MDVAALPGGIWLGLGPLTQDSRSHNLFGLQRALTVMCLLLFRACP